MKLSAFSVLYKDRPLDEVLDIFKSKGITHAEIGAGGFIGKEHCDPARLLQDKSEREQFQDLFLRRDMTISSLSCHGNPVHPQKAPGPKLSPGYQGRHRPGLPAWRGAHCNLLRMPGRLRELAVSELAGIAIPGGFSDGRGLAVGEKAGAVLERNGQICGRQRRQSGHGDARRLFRPLAGHGDPHAPGNGLPGAGREPGSQPPVVAGD